MLIYLVVETLHIPVIDIITQSDAWLPHNLKGEPQKEIYKYNAPRLKNALVAISQLLNILPVA